MALNPGSYAPVPLPRQEGWYYRKWLAGASRWKRRPKERGRHTDAAFSNGENEAFLSNTWTACRSTWVYMAKYDRDSRKLWIATESGRQYSWPNAGIAEAAQFAAAPSKGGLLNDWYLHGKYAPALEGPLAQRLGSDDMSRQLSGMLWAADRGINGGTFTVNGVEVTHRGQRYWEVYANGQRYAARSGDELVDLVIKLGTLPQATPAYPTAQQVLPEAIPLSPEEQRRHRDAPTAERVV